MVWVFGGVLLFFGLVFFSCCMCFAVVRNDESMSTGNPKIIC